MKLLVFSDSHRSLSPMREAVERERPDYILHLGDLSQDAEELSFEYPEIPVSRVRGNCDGWGTDAPASQTVAYAGTRILMGHGHLWHVKSGYEAAMAEARREGAAILLFGHTHVPYCRRQEDGLWVMNPGSVRDGDYGVILPGPRPDCRLQRV